MKEEEEEEEEINMYSEVLEYSIVLEENKEFELNIDSIVPSLMNSMIT